MTKRIRSAVQLGPLIVLGLLTTGSVCAQSASTTSGSPVEILKIKWEKQVRLPRNYDPSTIPENGVFSTMESRTAVPGSTQAPNGDAVRRDAAERSAALAPVDYFPKVPSRLPFSYLYSLKIRNVGGKTIKAVAWDYVFVNGTSQTIVGNHQLFSYQTVHPGASVTLTGLQRTRLISVIAAEGNSEKHGEHQKPLERATIECVLYEDDTAWRSLAARPGVCETLKTRQPIKTSKTKDQPSKSD